MTSLSDAIKNCSTLEKFTELMQPQYKIEGAKLTVRQEGSGGMSVKLGCCAGKSYRHTGYTGSVSQSFIVQKFGSLLEASLNTATSSPQADRVNPTLIYKFSLLLDDETNFLLNQNLFKRICNWIIKIFNKIFCVESNLIDAFQKTLYRLSKSPKKINTVLMKESDEILQQNVTLNKELNILISKKKTLITTKETPERNREIEKISGQCNTILQKMDNNALLMKQHVEIAEKNLKNLEQKKNLLIARTV